MPSLLQNHADYTQGELEHRTPKARFIRTDRKLFVKQLANMERRAFRLRRIRERLIEKKKVLWEEAVPNTPEYHHHIGITQNSYEHIGTFLRHGSEDASMKVLALAE